MKKITIILMAMLIMSTILSAQEITGLKIIENVYNRPTGQDQEGDLTMSLINSRGDKRVREIKQYLKEFGDMEKKIMFFVSPADVRNTSPGVKPQWYFLFLYSLFAIVPSVLGVVAPIVGIVALALLPCSL